ncbi:MAG: hypothetical protein SPL53_07315, partial [Bacteroidales bacterium]|nr:hypothetical protein [Bacteroidales bacterium]
ALGIEFVIAHRNLDRENVFFLLHFVHVAKLQKNSTRPLAQVDLKEMIELCVTLPQVKLIRSKARCMQSNVTFHAQVWALKNSIICFFGWRFVILETK